MSLMIKGMKLPHHSAVNGEKGTAYRCIILAHPDNTVELVVDEEFASAYDNGHNIQRYSITEIPTSHGDLIDRDDLIERLNLFKEEIGSSAYGFVKEIITGTGVIVEGRER